MITWEEAVESLRKDPAQAALVRTCYYDDPLLEAALRFARSEEWQAVRGILPRPPGKALELGAGRGISSYALARDGWDVTSLEPDPSDLVGAGAIRGLAESAGCSIQVVEEWGESLPFADGSFDLVYGRAVFHHARNLASFCSEAARVLKPGGLFLITREHVLTKGEDLEIFLKNHDLHRLYGGEAAYLLAEYEQAMTGAGMVLKRRIGPASSPINYFPETKAEHYRTMKGILWNKLGRIGALAARPLLYVPPFRAWLEDRMNANNNYPGRLYTFLAEKPLS